MLTRGTVCARRVSNARRVQIICRNGSSAATKVSRMSKFKQNFNVAGVSLFLQIGWNNNSLAIPHISIKDISEVDWRALRSAGLKGCVFDKDNTLCKPFALTVDAALLRSLEECIAAFDGKVALFSNSAGLKQYDPDGLEADSLEKAFGVKVLRHVEKKPAGGCSELEALFGCSSSEMVMVGDRYLTDVVYGNRHGMLTIRPAPLTLDGEPPAVLLARRVEEYCVDRWTGQGTKAPKHVLQAALDAVSVVRPGASVVRPGAGRNSNTEELATLPKPSVASPPGSAAISATAASANENPA